MKGVEVGSGIGRGLGDRFGRLTARVRSRVEALLNAEEKPLGEDLDLLLEDERIAEQDRISPADKRPSLLAGAAQMLEDGHPRQTVSVIYGDDITMEAEGLLTPSEWEARTGEIVDLSRKVHAAVA